MKKINKIFLPLCMTIMMLGLSSCEDFMDVHKEYIEGGEIIYAPKPVYIGFNAGLNRVQFNCLLYKSPNVRTVEVSWLWNSRKNVKEIAVTPDSDMFLVSTVFSDMEEGAYTFTVKTIDNAGHSSIEMTEFANVYDSVLFKKSLANRYAGVASKYVGTDVTVDFANAPASVAWTDIRYTTTDGATATAKLLPDQTSVVLPNGKLAAPIEYRSAYLLEEGAIDTVYKEWVKSDILNSLWVAGNGTSAEWDAGRQIEVPFDSDNPYVYICETDLDSNGGEIKILTAQGNWDGITIHPLVASGSILETTMQLYSGGADLKWKVVAGQDGRYRITIDLNRMEIYFVKL
jgi:hypothetical protein